MAEPRERSVARPNCESWSVTACQGHWVRSGFRSTIVFSGYSNSHIMLRGGSKSCLELPSVSFTDDPQPWALQLRVWDGASAK